MKESKKVEVSIWHEGKLTQTQIDLIRTDLPNLTARDLLVQPMSSELFEKLWLNTWTEPDNDPGEFNPRNKELYCPRCNVHMVEGIALQPYSRSYSRGIVSPGPISYGAMRMLKCFKCPKCGHSDDGD